MISRVLTNLKQNIGHLHRACCQGKRQMPICPCGDLPVRNAPVIADGRLDAGGVDKSQEQVGKVEAACRISP